MTNDTPETGEIPTTERANAAPPPPTSTPPPRSHPALTGAPFFIYLMRIRDRL